MLPPALPLLFPRPSPLRLLRLLSPLLLLLLLQEEEKKGTETGKRSPLGFARRRWRRERSPSARKRKKEEWEEWEARRQRRRQRCRSLKRSREPNEREPTR